MGRGRLPFTVILVLIFGAFLFVQPFADSREFRREVTCYNDLLHLDCGKSMIAIHEAHFTTAKQENHTCHIPVPEHDYIEDEDADDLEPVNDSICYEDIRIALNRKCSGFKSCNYSYSQQQEKSCYSPEGVFIVTFDCVRETHVNKYCNSKILSREGYISNPGYPQYYPDLGSCSWQITAPEGQTIFLSILHLHLREASDVTPTMTSEIDFHVMGQLTEQVLKRCDEDRVTVLEGAVKRFDVCGETLDGLKKTEVDGVAGLELRFHTVGFLPASGFLAYFKVQGCPTLAAAEDSYLVERNGSAAVYACRSNQVFNDSLESTRFLKCVRDHHWNDTLPPCISLDDATSTITMISSTSTEEEFINLTMAANEKINPLLDKRVALVGDIIIPTVIIGVLLIINGLVLVVIFMLRKRQKPIEDEFEELREQPTVPREDSPNTSLKESEFQPTSSKQRSQQNSPRDSEPQPTTSKQNSQQSSSFEAEPTSSKQNSPQSSPIGAVSQASKQNSPQNSPIETVPTTSKQSSPQSSPIKAEPTALEQHSQQNSPKEIESQPTLSKEVE